MTDLIELNDVVTDTMIRELRIGDHVTTMFDERLLGRVIEITKPEGELSEFAGSATVEVPPVVIVEFGETKALCQTEFLRAVTWRWQALDLKRLKT